MEFGVLVAQCSALSHLGLDAIPSQCANESRVAIYEKPGGFRLESTHRTASSSKVFRRSFPFLTGTCPYQ